MKNIRVNIMVAVAALAVFAGVVSLAARSSRGQTQSPKTDTRVKPTVLVLRCQVYPNATSGKLAYPSDDRPPNDCFPEDAARNA